MKFSVVLVEFLSVLLTTVTASRTFAKNRGRIVSGHDATAGQFPYMAAIAATRMGQIMLCSGSLIGRSWVLTAAHCFNEVDSVLVYLGSTHLATMEVGYAVPLDHIILHPDYVRQQLLHDIALISIPATDLCGTISTIALPSAQTAAQSYVGKYGLISGWGATVSRGYNSDHMKWGRMRVVDNEVCRQLDPLTNTAELCVEPVNNAAACIGDSGDPLVSESTIVGVVSHRIISEDCEDGTPVVFARVSFYLQWIKDVTGISH